jgi:hypothetical protein
MLRSTLLLAFAATTLAAQAPFEGAISMSVTGDNGKSRDLSYLVKGGKMRFDAPGSRGDTVVMIIDPAAKSMLMVMTKQKMYMEQEFAGAVAAAEANVKAPTVKRTGKMETIAGYKCEHVQVTEEGGATSDVCVTTGLGSFRMPMGGGPGGPPREPGWQSGVDKGGFPLKVVKDGKVTLEVTKIDKKSLDAALFAAPDGFSKFDMGAMMRRPRRPSPPQPEEFQ